MKSAKLVGFGRFTIFLALALALFIPSFFALSTGTPINFNILDSQVPNVTALLPLGGSSFGSSDSIEIAANVSDNFGVSNVLANITFPNGTVQQIILSNAIGSKWNASYTLPGLPGNYSVRIIAIDVNALVNSSEQTYFSVGDTTPPRFNDSELRPQIGSVFNQTDEVPIIVSVDENSTITATIYYPNGSMQLISLPHNGSEWFYLDNFTNTLVPGVYNVTINATDQFGNSNSTITNFTVLDIINPSVTTVSPGATIVASGTPVLLEAIVIDPYYDELASVVANVTWDSTFLIVNMTYDPISGKYGGNFTNTTEIGAYNFTIIAIDKSGNVNNTETGSFFVPDAIPPVINSINFTPKSKMVVNGSTLNVAINATDNIAIDTIYMTIIAPNGTIDTTIGINTTAFNVSYLTLEPGVYNYTIFVNDTSGNFVTETGIFLVGLNPIVFKYNLINETTGIPGSVYLYYGGGPLLYEYPLPSGEAVDTGVIDFLVDLLFIPENISVHGRFATIRLQGINLTIDWNSSLGYQEIDPNGTEYLRIIGLNNSYASMQTAVINYSYAGVNVTNENNLRIFRCDDYFFENRTCGGAWIDVTGAAVQFAAQDYFLITVNSFSGFAIKEVTPTPPSGGGGGGGGRCVERWVCEDYGSCIDGTRTRECYDSARCGTTLDIPIMTTGCAAYCGEKWSCTDWGYCDKEQQTRTCTDSNSCGSTTFRPAETQTCEEDCVESWRCSNWEDCDGEVETRDCWDLSECGTADRKPVLENACILSGLVQPQEFKLSFLYLIFAFIVFLMWILVTRRLERNQLGERIHQYMLVVIVLNLVCFFLDQYILTFTLLSDPLLKGAMLLLAIIAVLAGTWFGTGRINLKLLKWKKRRKPSETIVEDLKTEPKEIKFRIDWDLYRRNIAKRKRKSRGSHFSVLWLKLRKRYKSKFIALKGKIKKPSIQDIHDMVFVDVKPKKPTVEIYLKKAKMDIGHWINKEHDIKVYVSGENKKELSKKKGVKSKEKRKKNNKPETMESKLLKKKKPKHTAKDKPDRNMSDKPGPAAEPKREVEAALSDTHKKSSTKHSYSVHRSDYNKFRNKSKQKEKHSEHLYHKRKQGHKNQRSGIKADANPVGVTDPGSANEDISERKIPFKNWAFTPEFKQMIKMAQRTKAPYWYHWARRSDKDVFGKNVTDKPRGFSSRIKARKKAESKFSSRVKTDNALGRKLAGLFNTTTDKPNVRKSLAPVKRTTITDIYERTDSNSKNTVKLDTADKKPPRKPKNNTSVFDEIYD